MSRKRRKKKNTGTLILTIFIVAVIIILAVFGIIYGAGKWQKETHPLKYGEYVSRYSREAGLDEYLVYAFIKTESGFDEKAESYLGARGLMQIMPETFEWIRYRLDEENNPEISFDSMYEAEENIRYGCYLLKYLSDEFGGGLTEIAAAYHAGNGSVSSWLENEEYSENGKLIKIPNPDTAHYVDKISKAYETYCNLYTNDQ